MSEHVDDLLESIDPIDLAELDRGAQFLTRADRKYIVEAADVAAVLAELPAGTRVLETPAGRWSRYESTYFDTPTLDSYHLAARHRPTRFKVRTRRYVDSDLTIVEIKTKDRHGRTVKHRNPVDSRSPGVHDAVCAFARRHDATAPHAEHLRPTLTNRYARATLALPDDGGRVTIDAGFRATTVDGRSIGLGEALVIETKTSGKASIVDRLLLGRGHRPVRFSKYTTALAALARDLPANRWHRTLCRHLDAPAISPDLPTIAQPGPGQPSGSAAVLPAHHHQGADR